MEMIEQFDYFQSGELISVEQADADELLLAPSNQGRVPNHPKTSLKKFESLPKIDKTSPGRGNG